MFDVCMLVDNEVTKDSRVMREAESLANAGWDVCVGGITGKPEQAEIEQVNGFTVRRWHTPQSRFRLKIEHIRYLIVAALSFIVWYLPEESWLAKRIYRLAFWLERIAKLEQITLRQAAKQLDGRVYHAHDYPALLALSRAKPLHSIVYDSHELYFDRNISAFNERWYKLRYHIQEHERDVENRLIVQVIRIITVSDLIADYMAKMFHVERPVVVRNTVILGSNAQPATPFDAGDRRIVSHSGALLHGRHLPEVVDALQYLPDDVVLLLLGDGPLRDALQQRAETAGNQDRLIIVPPVPWRAVSATLSQADVGIILIESEKRSYRFSLPNKFFEAVGAGLPLVVSPVPEIKRLTIEYDIGIVCQTPEDPQSIAHSIKQALNPDENQRLRVNAQKARNELNWEKESQRLTALYAKLLGD